MIVYRVSSWEEVDRWKKAGVLDPVNASGGAEWGGEPRIYLWGVKHIARGYLRWKRQQLGRTFSLVTIRLPNEDVKVEDDPSQVAQFFGNPLYTTEAIPWSLVVEHR